jgi:Transglutaminase-like superfamily
MFRNSIGLAHPAGVAALGPLERASWLCETLQLDITSPKVRILASKLTQLLHTDRAKALAIHDHVKSLPFGCNPDFLHAKASDVIRLGYGDCHTKGLLLVALLRAVNVPARLRFVSLPTRFLAGLIDTGAHTMTHAIAEVYLNTRWVQTDTYVVDPELNREARELVLAQGHTTGYGVHVLGDQDWCGQAHARAQCTPADPDSLPVVDWGVAHDLAHFYANEDHAALRRSFMERLKWLLGAKIVNLKIEQIRKRGKVALETLAL